MSDYRSIAAVTLAMRRLLSDPVAQVDPHAKVTYLAPDSLANQPHRTGVNLFLFQVEPNAELRNQWLPSRSADGSLLRPPVAALRLNYLISFYGDSSTLVPELLMGKVITVLDSATELSPDLIRAAIEDGPTQLSGCNLAEQDSAVRLTPVTLNLEELSRLWTSFFQTAYVQSLVYQASVVLLEADGSSTAPLPILTPKLTMGPSGTLQLSLASSRPLTTTQGWVLRIVLPDSRDTRLVIDGAIQVALDTTGLPAGKGCTYWVTGPDAEPVSSGVPHTRLSQDQLDQLGIGPVSLVLSQDSDAGPRNSPAATGLVAPSITKSQVRDGTLVLSVSPPVGPDSATFLLLNPCGTDDGRAPQVLRATPRQASTRDLQFDITDVAGGPYLARLRVDTLESELQTDDKGFAAPKVVLP